ncbi:MAG: hypothetical protein JXR52_13025 [Bacteroidales bacterium]|nr:hypothetical protein [Bacteroidales bacterium]MBN2699742.1 hypothetical protein [Bacteroidales bacterium]
MRKNTLYFPKQGADRVFRLHICGKMAVEQFRGACMRPAHCSNALLQTNNKIIFVYAVPQTFNHIAPAAGGHRTCTGGHSIALRNNPGSTNLWTGICEAWLQEMGFLKSSEKQL